MTLIEDPEVIEVIERGPRGPQGASGSTADASTTVKGIVKLATAPASPTAPIAVGDNDSRLSDARTPTTHSHAQSDVTGLVAALAAKQDASTAATDTELAAAQATADAALPKAGGTMTGDIVLAGDPSANLHPATRQYVLSQIAALINSAPGALDTLKEIADQLATDESAVTALTSTVAGKLAAASNLLDLANAATARTNLGLGTAATHAHTDYDAAGAAAAAQAASQPLDSDLTAIAALSTTSYGRSLLAVADAAALRTLAGAARADSGTLAARPAAATFGVGYYLATDDDGGTLYYSNATAWTQAGPGVTEPSGLEIDFKSINAAPGDSSHINTTTTFAAVTGLTGLVVPAGSRPVKLRFGSQVFNTTATRGIFMAIFESGSLVSGSVFRSDSATASAISTLTGEVRLAAPASSKTYEIRIASTSATTSAQLLLGSANNYTAWFEAITR